MSRATGPLYDVHFRRRREGRTNYAKRLALLKGGIPRLVIRKLNKRIIVQVVEFSAKGDKTICQATSIDLDKYGFKAKRNVPSAYLLGFITGKKALAKKIVQVIPDFGLHTASKGGILFAAVKGARDSGLKINLEEEKLPSSDRINGKHIELDVSPVLAKIKEEKMI